MRNWHGIDRWPVIDAKVNGEQVLIDGRIRSVGDDICIWVQGCACSGIGSSAQNRTRVGHPNDVIARQYPGKQIVTGCIGRVGGKNTFTHVHRPVIVDIVNELDGDIGNAHVTCIKQGIGVVVVKDFVADGDGGRCPAGSVRKSGKRRRAIGCNVDSGSKESPGYRVILTQCRVGCRAEQVGVARGAFARLSATRYGNSRSWPDECACSCVITSQYGTAYRLDRIVGGAVAEVTPIICARDGRHQSPNGADYAPRSAKGYSVNRVVGCSAGAGLNPIFFDAKVQRTICKSRSAAAHATPTHCNA